MDETNYFDLASGTSPLSYGSGANWDSGYNPSDFSVGSNGQPSGLNADGTLANINNSNTTPQQASLLSSLEGMAPSLVNAGVAGIGDVIQNSGNNANTAGLNTSVTDAANIINAGYGAQLGDYTTGTDQMEGLNSQGLTSQTGAMNTGYDNYATDINNAVDGYGNTMEPAYNQYGTTLTGGQNQATGDLTSAYNAYAGMESPYTTAGNNALAYEETAMNTNPGTLTPAEQTMANEYSKQALTNLNSSGLRGSGAAITEGVNKGIADLNAGFYSTNQGRADTAGQVLANSGYGATQNTGAARQNLGSNTANLDYNTAGNLASTQYGLQSDVANKQFGANSNIASNDISSGLNTSNLLGNYYKNQGNLVGNQAQNEGNTALAEAQNTAGATRQVGVNNYNTANTNTNNTNSTIGKIGSILATGAKTAIASGANGGWSLS